VAAAQGDYPPIFTVVLQGGMIFPTGDGIGATHDVCAVMSPLRAAGNMSIFTVAEPITIIPGPAGTQLGRVQGPDMSVTRAAGIMSILVVTDPGGMIARGNPGWGTGVGTGAGGWIGA
jgi:hypothetical protein